MMLRSTIYFVLLVAVQEAPVGASGLTSSKCTVDTICRDGSPHWPEPCSCDPACSQYGDCCPDAPRQNTVPATNLSNFLTPDSWSCRTYMSKYLCPEFAMGRFSINSSCFTRDFDRNLSIILPNLTIYLNETKTLYNRGEYEFVDKDFIRVCRSAEDVPVLNTVSRVLMLISLVCMFLHMCIFLVQHRRSSIPRLTHFLMVLSLFIAELFFLLAFNANENYVACVIYGSVTYYFFTMAFFWMNVISLDTCRAFCSPTYGRATIKTFLCYFAYATVVPLAMSTLAVVVDQFVSPEFVFHPNLGTDRCWFNNEWGLIAFFICPVFSILTINLFLYITSVHAIHKQQKLARFASRSVIKSYKSVYEMNLKNQAKAAASAEPSSVGRKCTFPPESTSATSLRFSPASLPESPSPRYVKCLQQQTRMKVLRHRLVIYGKVALIMGMTWVFGLMYVFVKSPVVAYLNVIFNCLQGTFIFVAFDCTKNNRRKLWKTLGSYSNREKDAETC
ncbi:adhesion G protein-coupled receptor L3-like [Panulirus ornatus]|uniref:adhesion G protein-coupled receptor L3-like n=1 Tax=Panulirus ornatus TaxID=150431 RepID=UPI003A8B844C